MPAGFWFIAVALAAAGLSGDPRVRPLDQPAVDLIDESRRVSATVARQVDELEAGNLVVYVRIRLLVRCRTGHLAYLVTTGGRRHVLVEVAATVRGEQAVAMLGHELQHALEVARAPQVVDAASFERHFARIGHASRHPAGGLETEAALRAGAAALAEARAAGGVNRAG